jgi:transcriptional regulator with XRE-family HTH domain
VKQYRTEKGMTLQELADRSGYNDRSTVSKIERGMVDVPQSKILALADALGVTPLDLIGGDDIVEPAPYYLDPETEEIAQEIYEGKELRALFDVVRDISPEDMKTIYSVALALKRKERGES